MSEVTTVPQFVTDAVKSIRAAGSSMPSPAALKGTLVPFKELYTKAVGPYDGPWDRLVAEVSMINGAHCAVDTSVADVWLLHYVEAGQDRLYVIAESVGDLPFRVAMFPQTVGGRTVLRDLPPKVGSPAIRAAFDAKGPEDLSDDPLFADMSEQEVAALVARAHQHIQVRVAPDGTTTYRWTVVTSTDRSWDRFCSVLTSTLQSLGADAPIPQALLVPRFGATPQARRLTAIGGRSATTETQAAAQAAAPDVEVLL